MKLHTIDEPVPGTLLPGGEDRSLESEGPEHPCDVVSPLCATPGFVILVRERPPTRTESGLLLPQVTAEQTAQEKQMADMMRPMLPAVVVDVGAEITNIEVPCSEGDRVLTAGPAYGTLEGEWFIYEVAPFSAITAILNPPEED